MSNFLKNTTDLEKILYEISNISILLDNIQRRLKEIFLSVPQLITFTIDDVTYQAENGMTWGEWVESNYSINNESGISEWYFEEISTPSGNKNVLRWTLALDIYLDVSPETIIQANHNYETSWI